MIGLEDARRTARERLEARSSLWATVEPEPPALTIALKPPSERDALADQVGAQSWVRAWASADLPQGADVEWVTRSWPRLGRQHVPLRLRLADPEAVARFAGGPAARAWRQLSARVDVLRATLGASTELHAAVRRHAADLVSWPAERFDRVIAVVEWLATHPARGLRPRQVPIRGVDTKWLAAHRSVVTDLHAATTGEPTLGLVDADRLVRLRILDPTLAPGLPDDFAAPATQLGALVLEPAVVLILENLESILSLPAWHGCVAVHGSGYAVDVVGDLPWVASSRVVYWGDLDSHGFAILHRLRTRLPEVTSALMDEATLLAHRDLWVSEPKPTRAELTSLTAPERAARERLVAEGDVRLEQERIPWSVALKALDQEVPGDR